MGCVMDWNTQRWADGFKVTSEVPVDTVFMVLVPNTRTIHHEGDERSRTHPGHGYPAYTETVHSMDVYALPTEGDLLKLVEALGETKFTAMKASPVKFRKKVELLMELPDDPEDALRGPHRAR